MKIIETYIIQNRHYVGDANRYFKLHLVEDNKWFIECPEMGNGYFNNGISEISEEQAQKFLNKHEEEVA